MFCVSFKALVSLPSMSSVEELNYLSHHQQLLFKKSNNIRESVDSQRNCLIHTYSASTRMLTNESSLKLLETNLSKFATFIQEINNPHENRLILNLTTFNKNRGTEWHSNLHLVNINSILESLQCSQTTVRCPNTNNLKNHERLRDFSQCFDQNVICKEDTKFRKIAKRFAPQSCNLKDKRNTKAITDNGTQVEILEQYGNLKRTPSVSSTFKTAFDELKEQNLKKYGSQNNNSLGNGGQKRKLGSTRRNIQNKFVSPMLSNNDSEDLSPKEVNGEWPLDKLIDERLKNIDPRMVELIRSEIMDCGAPIHWDDIAGLQFAKSAIQEAVVWPLLRPDIFTGLRRPPKGILLFGPPGTGKTLIGKCVAAQSKSTFFSISASSLTSKWIGDGEKMVRALFCVARCHQPSVIFIDEIDSLLSQRSDTEHESSRRIKTEFLVQLDGATTDNEDRILVIGATNRPQELDEAARRRFVKRLYIPLPEYEARVELVTRLMEPERHSLIEENIKEISLLSDGYSGADIKNLCSEASLGPIRCIDLGTIQCIQPAEVRPISMEDFVKALTRVRTSVSPKDLNQYIVWNKTYGSGI